MLIGVLPASPLRSIGCVTWGVAVNEIREFLTTRRARITPQQAGLTAYGGRRRVTGLRREEVAMLAGISVEYYTQLERGQVRGVSEDVLEAVARALQLDDIEHTHLFDLVRAAKQSPTSRPAKPLQVRPTVQQVLDSITDGAAFIRNPRADFLTGNRLAYALYADAFPRSTARSVCPGSCSSIHGRGPSTASGKGSPQPRSAACAPKPRVIPTTEISPS